jgi:hypothetical protein
MKLEPQDEKPTHSRVDALSELVRDVQAPEADTLSVNQQEVPPWADTYEISSTEIEGKRLLLFSSSWNTHMTKTSNWWKMSSMTSYGGSVMN